MNGVLFARHQERNKVNWDMKLWKVYTKKPYYRDTRKWRAVSSSWSSLQIWMWKSKINLSLYWCCS